MPASRAWTCPTCGARYDLTPAGGAPQAPQGDGPTEKQIQAIHAIIKEDEKLEAQARAYCKDRYGAASSKELTRKQASELIDFLKSRELGF